VTITLNGAISCHVFRSESIIHIEVIKIEKRKRQCKMKNLLIVLVLVPSITWAQKSKKQESETIKQQTEMTDLFYEIEGHGKSLVLIHGGGTDSRVWDNIKSQLKEKYQVVVYDLRGHGQSPVPHEPVNHVDDLVNLLDGLELDQVSLIGHSLGGQIATDYALKYPEKVESLILLSPGLTGFTYDSAFQEMGQAMWKVVPDVDKMLNVMMNTPKAYAMQETMRSSQKDKVTKIHKENIQKSLTWKNFEQIWPEPPARDRLEDLTVVTLFIVGKEDKKDIFEIEKLFKSVPNIEFYHIEGADHGLVMTHPDEILKRLNDFLK